MGKLGLQIGLSGVIAIITGLITPVSAETTAPIPPANFRFFGSGYGHGGGTCWHNNVVSEILPNVTSDEIDNEIDVTRDEEIKGDKPPHHG